LLILFIKGDEFFYLDPHHSRPALELKPVDEYTEEVGRKNILIFIMMVLLFFR